VKLADLQIDILSDGTFRMDGGGMFGVVPKALWECASPADEQNRILMGMNCLLVRGRGKTVLVESGMGGRWSEKNARIYDIHRGEGLVGDLARHGVDPGEVTDLVLTHLHFDHVGGAVSADEDGSLRPTFPNARVHVQADMWEWAHNPEAKDGPSFRPEDIGPLGEADLKLHEGAAEVCDGIHVLPALGHTIGHQVVLLRTDEGSVLYTADLIPTAAHLRLRYVTAYDLFPQTTLKEKAEVLGRAADEDWIVVFCHDPHTPCVRIRRDEKGFAVAEEVEARIIREG